MTVRQTRLVAAFAVFAVTACGDRDRIGRDRSSTAFVVSDGAKMDKAEPSRSYLFVSDILRCLREVRDTKSEGATNGRNERQDKFLFAERLTRAGANVHHVIDKWRNAPEPRIREVAVELYLVGTYLQEMGSAYRAILKREGDADENAAIFKARQEAMIGPLFSAGALAANRDASQNLILSSTEKAAVVQLIEGSMFKDEMREFDNASQEMKELYVTEPELYSVIAFRNVYKREPQQC